MDKRRKMIILFIVLIGIFALFGGTFAYFSWQTAESQKTNVVFTLEQDFWCAADGGGDITQEDVDIAPASCMNSTHAIQRKIVVTPTILRDGLTIYMNLWLDIHSMGNGFFKSDNFRYALTTDPNSCTDGIVASGNFKMKGIGDKVILLNEMAYSNSSPQIYYLYIWLDAVETSPTTMGQMFSLSFSGNCSDNGAGDRYYVVYSETDNSLRFYDDSDEIKEGTTYNNLEATKVYNTYQNVSYSYDSSSTSVTTPWNEIRNNVTKIVVEDEIAPLSTANWFANFTKVSNVDVTNLNTSNVVDMSRMFDRTGYDPSVSSFRITGLDDFDTSKVITMSVMFQRAGYYATTWDIGDLSNWDVSNVVNMAALLNGAANKATTFTVGDLSDWDVSKVNNMYMMFTSGLNATTWSIGDLSGWDVSNVSNMYGMFLQAGYYATTWDIGDLSNWDVSNVTIMDSMFLNAAPNATTWSIGDLSGWDVSNVSNMYGMFQQAGYYATTWDIGDISGWNTSNVVNMDYMFSLAGKNATNWSQDLSGWNVNNVVTHISFNSGVEDKIIPPTWVN